MNTFNLVIIICLLGAPLFSQNLNELSDIQLVENLEKALFPINSEEEWDSVLVEYISYDKEKILLKGRRNRPNFVQADSILYEIQKRHSKYFYSKIIDIIRNYEVLYKKEWEVDYFGIKRTCPEIKATSFLSKPIDFQFFEKLENTLFALKIFDEPNLQKRYELFLNGLKNLTLDKNERSVSSIWKRSGRVSILKFNSFFLLDSKNLYPFILEEIRNFHPTGILQQDNYIIHLILFLQSAEEINNEELTDILIKKEKEIFGEVRGVFLYKLMKTESEKGLLHLIDLLGNTDNQQDDKKELIICLSNSFKLESYQSLTEPLISSIKIFENDPEVYRKGIDLLVRFQNEAVVDYLIETLSTPNLRNYNHQKLLEIYYKTEDMKLILKIQPYK